MDDDARRVIALKRAGYALAKIADLQMTSWACTSTETAKDIIAAQIMEAMNDEQRDNT
jgi:hypothetical protein